MKQSFFLILVLGLFMASCEDPTPHVLIDEVDSIPPVKSYSTDNYDGKIPGMDAKVIDYTLPDPYQHIPQLFLDSTVAPSWDDAGFPNAKDFQAFYKSFQWDVLDRNKEKISAMIVYPLPNFKDQNAFYKNFDSIFAPDFVDEILNQNPKEMYRNKNGAMAGEDGQVWFRIVKGKYRIVKINP